MLNPLVKEELKKCTVVDTSKINDSTLTYQLNQIKAIKLEEDCAYIIELDDMLLNDNNSVLAVNWNNGSVPNSKYYKIDVSRKVGNMIKIVGIGFNPETNTDLDIEWTGWLPINNIRVIQKL